MKKPHERFHEAMSDIESCAAELNALSVAFKMTGNLLVANGLQNLANDLKRAKLWADMAWSDEGTNTLNEAKAIVCAGLKAALQQAEHQE